MKLVDSLNPATQAENIKKLNAGLEAVDAKTLKDYSTTETATGQKWIDGKEIYFIATSGNLGTITETTNINLLNFVAETLINAVVTTGGAINQYIYTGAYYTSYNNVLLGSFSTSYSGRSYTALAYYTKPNPTPGRAPEDEPEEVKEPEEKKTTKKKTTK